MCTTHPDVVSTRPCALGNDVARLRHLSMLAAGVLLLWAVAGPTWAAEVRSAVALHGEPALPADAEHLAYTNPAAPKGGVLRTGVVGSFDTLNPHIVKGQPAAGLGYLFETLMARSWDEPFTLYGLLAEGVEIPEDRSAIVFHLNPKARWHDGTAVLAEDVLFSFDVQRRFGTPNRRQFYDRVARAEASDPRVVRFDFAPGDDGRFDRELPLIMGLMPIHQKAWWEREGDFNRTTLTPPMGSGPYRVAALDAGRRIEYERVADWWGAGLAVTRGLYNFDRLVFEYYRDDTVALEAFKAGRLDLRREGDPAKWRTGYDGPALARGDIVKLELPHRRPEFARGLIFNERRWPFGDVRVREALGMAVDFAWVNRTFNGDGLVRTASYYPNSELAARGLPDGAEALALASVRDLIPARLLTESFRLPAAAERERRRTAFTLLSAAGFEVRDGVLTDGQGRPVVFEILLGDPADERIAMEFARGLSRLGVSAEVRTVDSAQYQGRLDDFDYDMTIRGWISTLSPGNEQLYYFGTAAADQPGSRNYAGIRDPAVDRLAAALGQARTRADLVGTARALDRVLLWGHHMIPLFHGTFDRIAVSARIGRPATIPLYGAVVESWWEKR